MAKTFWLDRNPAGFDQILKSMAKPTVMAEGRRIASSAASAGMPVEIRDKVNKSRCVCQVYLTPKPGDFFQWRSRPDGSHYLKPMFSGNPLSKYI